MRFYKNKLNYTLFLILCLGAILRIYCASDNYLHPWDERYHALVAKNMMANPLQPTLYKTPILSYDYKEWYANHVWLHKPPLALWVLSASMKVFGVNIFAIRLPSFIFSMLSIYLTYLIAVRLFNLKIALYASFFMQYKGWLLKWHPVGQVLITLIHYSFF